MTSHMCHISYLNAVVALLVDDGNVAPAHAAHNFHHCFDLMVVGRNRAREILEALFVAQLRTGGEEGNLCHTVRKREREKTE